MENHYLYYSEKISNYEKVVEIHKELLNLLHIREKKIIKGFKETENDFNIFMDEIRRLGKEIDRYTIYIVDYKKEKQLSKI